MNNIHIKSFILIKALIQSGIIASKLGLWNPMGSKNQLLILCLTIIPT